MQLGTACLGRIIPDISATSTCQLIRCMLLVVQKLRFEMVVERLLGFPTPGTVSKIPADLCGKKITKGCLKIMLHQTM